MRLFDCAILTAIIFYNKIMMYNWILEYYFTVYFYSIFPLLFLFWFWITHVDKVHMKEHAKKCGSSIRKKLNDIFPVKNKMLEEYCYKQINTFCEVITGISDGLSNNPSTATVITLKDNNSQTCIPITMHETQTNIPTTTCWSQTPIIRTVSEESQTSIRTHDISTNTEIMIQLSNSQIIDVPKKRISLVK